MKKDGDYLKLKFEKKMILSALIITLIPLVLSYLIFVNDKISTMDKKIKTTLKDVAFMISQDKSIQEILNNGKIKPEVQEYADNLIDNIEGIDLIVICDINSIKYSHLDESQIGEVYVNPDNEEVLKEGTSYYSLMEGSMGTTFRWFEPIKYNGKQVGFVMIGKYYSDIKDINTKTQLNYFSLFIIAFILAVIGAKLLASKTKKSILNMEPEEIATLYNHKKIIINSVQDGIIALNKNNEISEINKSCYNLFNDFSYDKVIDRLKVYIDKKETFSMKELIIDNKKVFVTLTPIKRDNTYLGMLIILSSRENIKKIAKEITGVDEVVKNLRANVHEFKNTLHVILGLIQLEAYDKAKEYILKIKKVEADNSKEFLSINDYYVRALLLGRKTVAKERKVEFTLSSESNMYSEHGVVTSKDLVTILGNLIENAIESCALSDKENKKVELFLHEDDNCIEIKVIDNGLPICFEDKEDMFIEGVSSKGEHRGTGLYLVKNRVELYDGTIEIKETEEKKYFTINILKGGLT